MFQPDAVQYATCQPSPPTGKGFRPSAAHPDTPLFKPSVRAKLRIAGLVAGSATAGPRRMGPRISVASRFDVPVTVRVEARTTTGWEAVAEHAGHSFGQLVTLPAATSVRLTVEGTATGTAEVA